MHILSANTYQFLHKEQSMIQIQDSRVHVKGRERERIWGRGGRGEFVGSRAYLLCEHDRFTSRYKKRCFGSPKGIHTYILSPTLSILLRSMM